MDSWATSQSSRNKLANMTPCNNQSTTVPVAGRTADPDPTATSRGFNDDKSGNFMTGYKKGKVLVMVFQKKQWFTDMAVLGYPDFWDKQIPSCLWYISLYPHIMSFIPPPNPIETYWIYIKSPWNQVETYSIPTKSPFKLQIPHEIQSQPSSCR